MKTIVRTAQGYVNVNKTTLYTIRVLKMRSGFISFANIRDAINAQLNDPKEYVTSKMVKQSIIKLLSERG